MIKNRRLLIFSALLAVILLIMWSFYISQNNLNKGVKPTPIVKATLTPSVALTVTQQPTSGTVGSLPESVAPNFELNNLQGQKISLSDYKGKLVILNFWKTWEPQCKAQLSVLNAVNKELKPDDNVAIITINDQSSDAVKQFLKENKYNITVLNDKNQNTFNSYNVMQIPITYIIDDAGIIKEINTNVMSKEDVYNSIDKYGK